MPSHFDAASVDGDSELSWMSNNAAKHPPRPNTPPRRTEVWTVLSTGRFGQQHKQPQASSSEGTTRLRRVCLWLHLLIWQEFLLWQEFLEGTAKSAEVVGRLLSAVRLALH